MAAHAIVRLDPPPHPRVRSPWSRALVVVAGCALLLAGLAMLLLPGPGIPAVIGGLWLLGDEVPQARRARTWLSERVAQLRPRR